VILPIWLSSHLFQDKLRGKNALFLDGGSARPAFIRPCWGGIATFCRKDIARNSFDHVVGKSLMADSLLSIAPI